ncbi:MAG: hypothetical protein GY778_03480 [bacterium]|nr:hypothetical protein [bacterium]
MIVQLQFDVLRVELPADVTRHSAKVWNHVDELRADAARTALLRRNGLRVGVASTDAWPALKAIFEACDAQVLRATHTVQRGLPLTLELGQIVEDESVFLIAADDRMTGTTFTTGGKYLHLDYEYGVPGEGQTRLQITPEIRDLQPRQRWSAEGGRVRSTADYRGRLFTELSCLLDVGADELLVIGPDPAHASALTVGRRFLTRRHEGRTHETILCIAPQPFRTESGER